MVWDQRGEDSVPLRAGQHPGKDGISVSEAWRRVGVTWGRGERAREARESQVLWGTRSSSGFEVRSREGGERGG